MSEPQSPRRADEPLPRDREDQQAAAGDPLSVPVPVSEETDDGKVPDPDEAGTGPRGRPRDGTVHPEHPTPEEPAD
ncbi:hypothetical protein ABTY59_19565 [Streptomyces sp. NPDC096079]|uniref:hypothetical protein n=1 Tax=unclassified Streptomyces TaxID=2593676 RepID=UPI00331B131F